ncbi:MAG TPA: PAS domain S-box protein [Gemmatimonadales bacterium]|nr:PAS domain S-box protein [Gemmatimonadales bacterium]
MAHRIVTSASSAAAAGPAVIAARWLGRLPSATGAAAAILGLAGIEAYVFGPGPLIWSAAFLPHSVPLTLVMFVLAGGSLLSLRAGLTRHLAVTAGVASLVALLVLAEYLVWRDLGLDRLLFPDDIGQMRSRFPGRPAPITAACFLLLGVALCLTAEGRHLKHRRAHAAVLMLAGGLPLIPVVGHAAAVPELHSFAPGVGVSLAEALLLMLLAGGVAAATHRQPILELLTGQDPGTILLRRLLPAAVMIPVLFAAGSLLALHVGYYQKHVVLALFIAAFGALSLLAAFRVAAVVRRADAERRAAEWSEAERALGERLLEAEQAAGVTLRESVRQTRELLDLLNHAPVLARGPDGRIQFWSAGARRLYGWDDRDAIGADAIELLHTELPVPPEEAAAALLEKGEWHAEISRRSRTGARVQVASHWILHRDAEGRPGAVIEVDNDVTEQKRAEEALRRGEARYRALVAAAAQIVWTASADGRRPIDTSQWEAFTGQTASEATWGGWFEAIHPDDRAEAVRAWDEAVAGRRPLATEHRLRRRDGEYRSMEVRAVPVLDDQGRIREWVGAHTDITDRLQAEEQLSQAQRLQAVGTLAGGVAHEVNNQLMAVLGFGEFVIDALGPDHPQAGDVREMVSAATRAARVAQQLLTFSRRQVKQTELLDLHGVITALGPVLERLLGADKTLVVLPNRARCRVMADRTQIDQVLINLAANARDAMRTGGRLTIGVDEVVLDREYAETHHVSRLVPGRYARVVVSDTGSGMSKETLAKIFEPFYTTKPVGVGTGLGLSTVYGIVKQHEGFIWPYSEVDVGTTMKVYLPAAPTDAMHSNVLEPEPRMASHVAAPVPVPAGAQPALVLVVEDEPAIRSLVRRTLEGAGMLVIEAENGRQALDIFALGGEPPRLVLSDVIMPEVNGPELSDALADLHPTLPILFMSGYTGDDVLARSLLPETAPFIQKPFAPEELLSRVRGMLAGASTSEVR